MMESIKKNANQQVSGIIPESYLKDLVLDSRGEPMMKASVLRELLKGDYVYIPVSWELLESMAIVCKDGQFMRVGSDVWSEPINRDEATA